MSITLKSGVQDTTIPDSNQGKTVSELADLVSSILNLPEFPVTILNGQEVEDDTVARAGDVIEFVKPSGKKAA